jgi:hypothetical protein
MFVAPRVRARASCCRKDGETWWNRSTVRSREQWRSARAPSHPLRRARTVGGSRRWDEVAAPSLVEEVEESVPIEVDPDEIASEAALWRQ